MSPKLAVVLVLSLVATGCDDTRSPGEDAGSSIDAGPAGDRCEGYATPCSLISDSLVCGRAFGCRPDDDCTGVAESCYSQYSSSSCNGQNGCRWDYTTERCSGLAGSCGLMGSSYSCRSQDGCRWREGCSGVAWQCSRHDGQRYDCEDQPGCFWVE